MNKGIAILVLVLIMQSVFGQVDEWNAKARVAVQSAIPRAEKDPSRPIYHFRPPAQWMNDICGAIYFKGNYHIFYQFNPFADTWGEVNTCWGHARSKDLTNWEYLPHAIVPQTEMGELRCNSGSVALNGNGTPMIFYTFVPANDSATRLGKREQWAAMAKDDELISWKRIERNPILAAGIKGIPESIKSGWSDPFVFKSGPRTFLTFKSSGGLVAEADNKELTSWTYAGRIDGIEGECPNFFKLGDKWVLLRSTYPPTYVIGQYLPDEMKFIPDQGKNGTLDYAYGPEQPSNWSRGFYGTNVLFDNDDRCILLGWVSGFREGRGWNGCMSIPRVLTLGEDGHPRQTPASELEQLRGKHNMVQESILNNEVLLLDNIEGDAMEIVVEFLNVDADSFGVMLRQSQDGNQSIQIKCSKGKLNVAGTEVPLRQDATSGKLKLHIFMDKSVLEVFVNDGAASITRVIYPGESDLNVSAFATGGEVTLRSLDAWVMKSIW